jgi:peptide deformylase
MDIELLGSEALRQKAEVVRPIGPEYRKIAADMLAALDKGKGIGLAGPQVGLNKRIFVVHLENDAPRYFINPSIIGTSAEQNKYEEGCMSIPGVFADVMRPASVKVQAWNERGRPFTLEAEGLLARVIQHEMDHLDGLLFIDRLSAMKRKAMVRKYERRGHTVPESEANREPLPRV